MNIERKILGTTRPQQHDICWIPNVKNLVNETIIWLTGSAKVSVIWKDNFQIHLLSTKSQGSYINGFAVEILLIIIMKFICSHWLKWWFSSFTVDNPSNNTKCSCVWVAQIYRTKLLQKQEKYFLTETGRVGVLWELRESCLFWHPQTKIKRKVHSNVHPDLICFSKNWFKQNSLKLQIRSRGSLRQKRMHTITSDTEQNSSTVSVQ